MKFVKRIQNLNDKYLVKKALNVQIIDDSKGHFNWVSEVIEIMKENNINEMQISKSDISTIVIN